MTTHFGKSSHKYFLGQRSYLWGPPWSHDQLYCIFLSLSFSITSHPYSGFFPHQYTTTPTTTNHPLKSQQLVADDPTIPIYSTIKLNWCFALSHEMIQTVNKFLYASLVKLAETQWNNTGHILIQLPRGGVCRPEIPNLTLKITVFCVKYPENIVNIVNNNCANCWRFVQNAFLLG